MKKEDSSVSLILDEICSPRRWRVVFVGAGGVAVDKGFDHIFVVLGHHKPFYRSRVDVYIMATCDIEDFCPSEELSISWLPPNVMLRGNCTGISLPHFRAFKTKPKSRLEQIRYLCLTPRGPPGRSKLSTLVGSIRS